MPQMMKIITSFLLLGVVQTIAALVAGGGADDQFVYSGFTGANLTMDGTATVTPVGLLELTNGTLQLKGHAFHPTPLRFREGGGAGAVRSFSASFVFGILSAYPDISAHGIVFVVSPTTNFSAALASQYLGLVNVTSNGDERNRMFAVELDTLQQDEFRDINDNHVGIDVNSLISLNSSDAGYYDDDGSFKNLSLISHEDMRVWVDYDAVSNRINVTLAPLGLVKPAKPLISAIYNLSAVLTDMAYVGFSSATGSFNSRHYVLGFSFAMDVPAPDIDITKLPKLPREGPKARSKVLEIVLPIASAAVVFCLGTVIILFMRRRTKYSELREDWEVEFGPHRFPYKDLHRATEGFRNKNLLGVGGFGRVYKVYDYMSNGSLDKYLYDHERRPTLSWPQRFKIIKDIASGLLYLHEEWEKVVIHRDIKASNVLLDSGMNGRLGDFGLARLYNHGTDPQTTHVVGTIGYLAPELARTSKATPLTDVFAFGTFILEVTCGRRPIFQDASDKQVMLVDWVLEHWREGTLVDTVDANLRGDFIVSEACLVLELGLMCSHPFVNARPSMRQVVQYLSKEVPLPELIPTNMSFHMLALTQNQGFDSYIRSYPSSSRESIRTTSLASQ
ncbi:hypothetical protein SETIT_4G130200v2 [Setaria italica]|uniref:non-specific serine/threonine protein kinase n=1 Tax=Setaria italica TaxID=4555 RepID=A0A368QTT3_SETIT|nr:hypothetical protein SETIT_4G130200v2 [Setaria italica]